MIKFVCGGCGERLSVPDQHGGRKGVCPTCQTVNRIPLKGYAETASRAFEVKTPAKGAAPTPEGALSAPVRERMEPSAESAAVIDVANPQAAVTQAVAAPGA